MFKSRQKGFTLIELLVVISIIGLLSTVIMTAVEDNRNKAKDRALVASAIQLRNALELYKSDNGFYPVISLSTKNAMCTYTSCDSEAQTLKNKLAPYISDILKPAYPNTFYVYATIGSMSPIPNVSRRCEGQNTDPQYMILIQTKNDKSFPRYLYMGNLNSAYRCLSSPE
jgi:type II secretion system protein G